MVDELLLRRAKDGDPDAFDRLITDLEPMIWRVCWHYTGNSEDAADCGQDSMLRLWRGLSSYHGESAFETWVYRIAANCCMDFLRKKKRNPVESLEPLREQGFDPPDDRPGTAEQVLASDSRARLRAAIAALPEDQRDALILTQLEGKSYEETALLLSVSEGTVKSRVNRARAKLKEIISEENMELSTSSGVKKSERRARR